MSADGLLDTSAAIRMPTIPADRLPVQPAISTVSLAELSLGPMLTDDPETQAERQAHLQYAEAHFAPLPVDVDVARAFTRVAVAWRQQGRTSAARAFDALIAATALSHDLPLHTANVRDFEGIPGLTVVDTG